ncbi:MAG: 30S ribosomal protein S13 [bacterium]
MRVGGVEIPSDKRIEIALTYIYGIGRATANDILDTTQVDKDKRTHELTSDEVTRVRNIIEDDYTIEGELRNRVKRNIQRLKEIGCYRGDRHEKGLPVRGQRTRCNARTRKGPRKTVAGKDSAPAPS